MRHLDYHVIHQRAAHGKFFYRSQVFLMYLPGIPGNFIKIIDLLLRSGQCRRKCCSDIFNKILFIMAYRMKIDFNCNCNIFSYNAIERYIATTKNLWHCQECSYIPISGQATFIKTFMPSNEAMIPFFCFQNFFGVYIQ